MTEKDRETEPWQGRREGQEGPPKSQQANRE